MLTKNEKRRVIEWITCGGQVDGIQEEAMPRATVPNAEIEDFIFECGDVLLTWLKDKQ